MVWTVFEHNHGRNETRDDAPGRGGYKYVLVPLRTPHAIDWWEDEYDRDPTRTAMPYPESKPDTAWFDDEYEDPDEARRQCGELTEDRGAIGVPTKRYYTWNELNGRLDVRVVTADEL